MVFKGIAKTYQHLKRFKQIIEVLIKYGFGFLIEKIGLLEKLSRVRYVKLKDIEKLTLPERLRLVLEELGPTFIKLGQILSTRPDILPEKYIIELSKLQDNVKEFDSNLARKQFEISNGKTVDASFEFFDDSPIASASIAQVHTATLKTGEKVVVKIQRPGLEKIIETDIEILIGIARFAESKVNEIKVYNPVGIVEEFADAIRKELDFTKEAWNIEKFKKNFEDSKLDIAIPNIYWDFTSKKVITMEYIDGQKINSTDNISKVNRAKICETLANSTMKQVFEDGFFHADPHPGNILIVQDSKIAYIDFGMMGRINKKLMTQIAELLIGTIDLDEDRVAQSFLDIGLINDNINIDQFKLDIYELLENYHGKTLKQIDMVQFLNEVFKVAIEHGIVMPSVFTLLLKTLVTVEGICRNLDCEFNIVEFAQPFVENLIRDRINIKSIIKESMYKLRDTNRYLLALPAMVNDFFKKANSGNLKIDFQHKGLDDFLSEINKMVNKLVLSIIIAALLMGSALVVQVDRGPFVYGFPIIGVIGFSFAGLLGLWLVFNIIRSGKM